MFFFIVVGYNHVLNECNMNPMHKMMWFSTYQCFDNYMQRSKRSIDYVLSIEVCVMVNVVFSSKSRAAHLEASSPSENSRFRTTPNLDDTLQTMLVDMATGIREKLLSILEVTLSKMARYDEGNPIGQIGAFLSTKPKTILNTVKNLVTDNPGPAGGSMLGNLKTPSGSSMALSSQTLRPSPLSSSSGGQPNSNSEHLGQTYIRFLCQSSEQLQTVIVDEEWVNQLFEVGKLFIYIYIFYLFLYILSL
jgi:hypothetical protein